MKFGAKICVQLGVTEMNNVWIILTMIFFHIVDDYRLQGILASMKQKKWWKQQEQYNDKYKYDYIVALLMHSFSWTFMIMLPIAFYYGFRLSVPFIVIFVLNVAIHCIVDDLKANKLKINLVLDQTIHIIQIIITAIVLL